MYGVFVHVSVHTHVQVHVHMCEGLKLALGIYVNFHHNFFFLRQNLSLDLGLINLARLTGQRAPGSASPPLAGTGITHMSSHA